MNEMLTTASEGRLGDVQIGDSRAQIERVLGTADAVVEGGDVTIWKYGDAQLTFDAAGQLGKIRLQIAQCTGVFPSQLALPMQSVSSTASVYDVIECCDAANIEWSIAPALSSDRQLCIAFGRFGQVLFDLDHRELAFVEVLANPTG